MLYMKQWLKCFKQSYNKCRRNNKSVQFLICPPPNLTGNLHIGHLLEFSIIDFMSRCSIILNFPKKIYPLLGYDHAGLYAEIIARKNTNNRKTIKNNILQNRKICLENILVDISSFGLLYLGKHAFTLSNISKHIVQDTHSKLIQDNTIFSDFGLINWDVDLQTALSDLEVDYKVEKGKLFYLKYFIKNDKENRFVTVATTRPETIFADIALAVNPNDKRYIQYHNCEFVIPLTNRSIRLICDEYVDINFGTGVLKITPCHDKNDFNIAIKHNLQFKFINLINKFGKLTYGICKGMTVSQARDFISNKLNLQHKTIEHNVPINSRTGNTLEFIISIQSYLDLNKLSHQVNEYLSNNTNIEIYPENVNDILKNFIMKSYKWCISRNGNYGHLIHKSHSVLNKPYILDTWFSSSLWPEIIVKTNKDLIKNGDDFSIILGKDIIFFWLLKMLSMSIHINKHPFFRSILCHGLVCDKSGNKISKSKNNAVPIQEILASETSKDAFRMCILSSNFYADKIIIENSWLEMGKRHCTKITNINIFIKKLCYELKVNPIKIYRFNYQHVNILIYFIIEKLYNIVSSVNFKDIHNYVKKMRDILWNDISSCYLVYLKNIMAPQEMKHCLILWKMLLNLMHPIQPYITEYCFQDLYSDSLFKNACNQKMEIQKILYSFLKQTNARFSHLCFIYTINFVKEFTIFILNNVKNISYLPFKTIKITKNNNYKIFKQFSINIIGSPNENILYEQINLFIKEINKLENILKLTPIHNLHKINILTKSKLDLEKGVKFINSIIHVNNLNKENLLKNNI